jgi:L-ascorbate metabolism protein UlaG (beta-lactamase superfamily)
MELQLIRSATLRLNYAGHTFVIDPYLAAKHSRPPFTGKSPNPLVDLPCSPAEVILGIEAAFISHLHSDHFDPSAQALLPKDTFIFCQPGDAEPITLMGFSQVAPIEDLRNWQGSKITRTPCQHGSGDVLALMGQASGFLFQAEGEPTLYWTGYTIWYERVADVIARTKPEVIVTHSCGAVWGEGVLIVMDAIQTVAVCQAAPGSRVVATHLDSLDHATVSREALRHFANTHGIGPEQLLIPADGEVLVFDGAS